MKSSIALGIDILLTQSATYRGQRLGLLSNAASLTSEQIHSRIALQQAGFSLARLFAPEHGFDIQGADGAFIDHQIDALTKIPIVSLYGERLAPTADDLDGLDLMVIDLPDIGARFYTYLWTMTYVMESCAQQALPVLVLDRPNPMAYDLQLAEGPLMDPRCRSFIGRYSIPVTHQCTFGELARYFQATYYPQLQLEVIDMVNWNRKTNTGYPFLPTSPAIQRRETVYTYAGACLFEGLNIQEGRGTDYPFAQFGAPWIDADLLLREASSLLSGADLSVVHYRSTESIFIGEQCNGLRIIPQQPQTFQSFSYFIALIGLIDRLFAGSLQPRNYLTNVNPTGSQHLDKLVGIPDALEKLKNQSIDTQAGMTTWAQTMKPYLAY